MDAARFGVDEIRCVQHFGRYTARFPVPRRFVWERQHERDVDCPLIQWRIGGRWFAAVIPIEPDQSGRMDQKKAEQALRSLIEESRLCQLPTTKPSACNASSSP